MMMIKTAEWIRENQDKINKGAPTMNKMVEQVARAMATRRGIYAGIDADQIVLDVDNDKHVPYWTLFTNDARVAIEAMREPTDRMADASLDAEIHIQGFDELVGVGPDEARLVWRTMIDAALKD